MLWVLACALFEEIKDENITQDATEDADTEDDPSSLGEDDNTPSVANSNSRIGTSAVALMVFAVSSFRFKEKALSLEEINQSDKLAWNSTYTQQRTKETISYVACLR